MILPETLCLSLRYAHRRNNQNMNSINIILCSRHARFIAVIFYGDYNLELW